MTCYNQYLNKSCLINFYKNIYVPVNISIFLNDIWVRLQDMSNKKLQDIGNTF